MSDSVCGSGRSLVPTTDVIPAHTNQPIRAPTVPTKNPSTPYPALPIPAATDERITTPIAWPMAVSSASTSS